MFQYVERQKIKLEPVVDDISIQVERTEMPCTIRTPPVVKIEADDPPAPVVLPTRLRPRRFRPFQVVDLADIFCLILIVCSRSPIAPTPPTFKLNPPSSSV